jgi:type I restriction enzyme S subunit
MRWEMVRLGEVCEVSMGQAPPGSSYNDEGIGTPLVAGAGDLGTDYPEPTKHTSAPTRLARAGDIILCIRATIGDRSWADRTYCLGRGVAGLRPRGDHLDPRYLWHWLGAVSEVLSREARGSTFKQVGREAVEALKIPLPPLPEQRRIAAILDKADAIRRKRLGSLALLDELLRSTFLEMFGDPVRNERGWEVVRLGDVAEDLRYGTSTKCQTTPSPGSFPVLRIPNVVGGAISLDDLKYARLPAGQVEPVRLRKGDILFVRTNGNPGYIGRCAVFNEDLPALFASYLIRARIKGRKGCLPEFLVGMMSLPSYRARFVAETRTTAGNYNLSASGLRSLELIMPPIDLQRRYLSVTETVKGEQDRQSEHLNLATHLFESLSQRAFQAELPG